MTEAQLKRLVNLAARNARRSYRTADTSGEKLERWFDRQIRRKTRILATQASGVIPLYEDYRSKVIILEKRIAEFINAAQI